MSEEKILSLLSGSRPQVQTFKALRMETVGRFVVLLSPLYGLVMGAMGWFAGFNDLSEQLPQMVFSAIKMPILLLATVVIALPAFFVFNSLAGLRDDFADATYSIIASLATFSIAIVSLAPFTAMYYLSVTPERNAYRIAILFNALIFAIASFASFISLLRSYQKLISRDSNHRMMFWTWVVLFSFVGIQLGWTLRPFIGNPFQETTFFREESFTSAYLQLFRIVRSLF